MSIREYDILLQPGMYVVLSLNSLLVRPNKKYACFRQLLAKIDRQGQNFIVFFKCFFGPKFYCKNLKAKPIAWQSVCHFSIEFGNLKNTYYFQASIKARISISIEMVVVVRPINNIVFWVTQTQEMSVTVFLAFRPPPLLFSSQNYIFV